MVAPPLVGPTEMWSRTRSKRYLLKFHRPWWIPPDDLVVKGERRQTDAFLDVVDGVWTGTVAGYLVDGSGRRIPFGEVPSVGHVVEALSWSQVVVIVPV